ncbi:hypothetical protein TrVE_jg12791 [Triparma verrucosa]|uniref:Uncharacterized protein n=1 Tax=Triparma verrucosa TaxID=1606542 RepID=A0A9W7CA85_9STRA|nr:hypothetical protein TrVE_jg12791 [Triparma verrucosa]
MSRKKPPMQLKWGGGNAPLAPLGTSSTPATTIAAAAVRVSQIGLPPQTGTSLTSAIDLSSSPPSPSLLDTKPKKRKRGDASATKKQQKSLFASNSTSSSKSSNFSSNSTSKSSLTKCKSKSKSKSNSSSSSSNSDSNCDKPLDSEMWSTMLPTPDLLTVPTAKRTEYMASTSSYPITILLGPCGIGKSSMVHLLTPCIEFEVDFNSWDGNRVDDEFLKFCEESCSGLSLEGDGSSATKFVLIQDLPDDVEIVKQGLMNFLGPLSTKLVIILSSSSYIDPIKEYNLADISRSINIIKFNPNTKANLLKAFKGVLKCRGCKNLVDDKILKNLAEKCNGDVRVGILELQIIVGHIKHRIKLGKRVDANSFDVDRMEDLSPFRCVGKLLACKKDSAGTFLEDFDDVIEKCEWSVDTVSCYMNGYMVPFYDDVPELCDGFAAMSDAVHIGDSFPFEYGGTGGEGYKKGIVARAVAANGGGGKGSGGLWKMEKPKIFDVWKTAREKKGREEDFTDRKPFNRIERASDGALGGLKEVVDDDIELDDDD